MTSSVTATFLFTDLVDSTAIAARLGAEEADALRRAHFAILRAACEVTGGVEVKSLGDGIMLMFTSPSRAVSCGVAIQQGIERHNQRATQPLAVRVGIATGEALEEDDDYFGDAVVEAARLSAASDGGQILTTDLVRMLLGRHAVQELVSVGDLELKGIPDPVATVEVRWEPEARAGTIPLPTRFVSAAAEGVFGFFGRTSELQEIGDALKRADAERTPHVVLLAGEPGIGKTTLAAQAARAAHEQGATALFGHCTEDLGAPYQPWIEALRHLVDHSPPTVLEEHVERHGEVLARLVSSLARTAPATSGATTDPESERFFLFEAVSALLAVTAAEHPLVVVLDDFQWADAASVQLVRHVAGATNPAAVLLVITYRDSDITRGHPVTALIGDLPRIATTARYSLKGLDDRELVEMVEGLAGHQMTATGLEFVHVVHRETDGNPFFATELLRHLWETGGIVLEDGEYVLSASLDEVGLPSSVRDVVMRRIDRLGDEAARVLIVAAVIGRDFELGVLAEVAELNENTLLDLLDTMVAASIVGEHGDVPGMYRFEHALIQHTLYQELGATRRQRMHQRIAETLDRDGTMRPAAQLARHWLSATRPTDVEKALQHVRAAGDEALALLAPDDAVGWYTQALELADRVGVDETVRCDLLIALGNAQQYAGIPEHRQTLLDAAALAQRLGDDDRLVAAALANTRGTNSMVADEERVAALEAALAVVPENDAIRRAQLLVTLAGQADPVNWERKVDLARLAVDLARHSGDDALLLRVSNSAALNICTPDLLDERLEIAAESIRLADRIGDPVQAFQSRFQAVGAFAESGDDVQFRRLVSELEELARRAPLPFLRWQLAIVRTALLVLGGQFSEADTANDAMLELGTATGQAEALGVYGAVLIVMREQQGRLDEVVEVVEEAARDMPGIDSFRPALASMWCQLGDTERAHGWYDADARVSFTNFGRLIAFHGAMIHSSDAAIELGDKAGAAALHDLLLPYRNRLSFSIGTVEGSTSLTLGSLATFLGRFEAAAQYFAEARELLTRFDARYFLTLADLEEALLLVARAHDGDAARARELAQSVVSAAAEYGFGRLDQRARELLAQFDG